MPEKRIVFHKGKKYTLVEETDRYYICAKTAFRKANPDIQIRIEPQEVTEKQEKKKAEKKAKKAAEKSADIEYPNQDTIEEGEEE